MKKYDFYESMIAKIKYLVRTVICKLGDAVHLLNTNPDGTDWCIKSSNRSDNFVMPSDAGNSAEQKRGRIEILKY